MKTLGDLLLKYKIPGVRDSEIRKICAEEVLALTGWQLAPQQVKYKHEQLTLHVAPVLKSNLLMRQGELLERIRAREVAIHSVR
jgi:hypothetical protein